MKNYVRIDFKNTAMDYDYTICPASEIEAQMSAALWEILEITEPEMQEHGKPEIIVSPCFMTEAEYEEWFKKNVEANA